MLWCLYALDNRLIDQSINGLVDWRIGGPCSLEGNMYRPSLAVHRTNKTTTSKCVDIVTVISHDGKTSLRQVKLNQKQHAKIKQT